MQREFIPVVPDRWLDSLSININPVLFNWNRYLAFLFRPSYQHADLRVWRTVSCSVAFCSWTSLSLGTVNESKRFKVSTFNESTETLRLLRLAGEVDSWGDDILCTSANLVCMWHPDWTVLGGVASFAIRTGLLTLISWKWLEAACGQIVLWTFLVGICTGWTSDRQTRLQDTLSLFERTVSRLVGVFDANF